VLAILEVDEKPDPPWLEIVVLEGSRDSASRIARSNFAGIFTSCLLDLLGSSNLVFK